MLSDDRVRPHHNQGRAPASPPLGQHDPEQPILTTESRTLDVAFQGAQLLTEREVFQCDGLVSAAGQSDGSEEKSESRQHALSWRQSITESTG
jgi:hypothetical protein